MFGLSTAGALAAVVAVAGLAVPAPARADAVDDFDRICLETNAQIDRVAEAAFDLGWKLAPPRPTTTTPSPGDREMVFVRPAGQGGEQVLASSFTPKTPQGVDSVFSSCTLTAIRSAADLDTRLAERLGRPGLLNDKGFYVWMVSRRDGKLVHETGLFNGEADSIRRAWAERSVYTVLIIPEQDGSASLLVMAARRPGEP